ncbi:MAG: hypothetical protein ACOH1R_10795 [Luteimonas sp.]
MDIQICQRIDFCYFIDAYRAHHIHFDTRAERLQPAIGMIFAGGSIVWMLNSAPAGIGTFLLSFVFFWGLFLISRQTLLRILYFLRTAWKIRSFSYEESLKFFDDEYARSDFSQTQRISWGSVRSASFSAFGITLVSEDNKTYLISNRAAPAAEYARIRLFLGEKFPGAGLKKVAMQ